MIIDAAGMSLSAVAVLKGFLEYRESNRIAGVLFNRMSKQVYEAIRPEVELLGICPLGYVPRLSDMELPSRHLGLVTPEELEAEAAAIARRQNTTVAELKRFLGEDLAMLQSDLKKRKAAAWVCEQMAAAK